MPPAAVSSGFLSPAYGPALPARPRICILAEIRSAAILIRNISGSVVQGQSSFTHSMKRSSGTTGFVMTDSSMPDASA